MNNENLQDIMLEPDSLIDYGGRKKAIKDFFGCNGFYTKNYSIDAYKELGDGSVKKFFNQSPVVIIKDINGKPIKALDLVEFEEHIRNEFVKSKDKNSAFVVKDYDILYRQYLFNGDSYRCYHGCYDSNDTSVVDSIKKYCKNDAFSKIRDELAKAYDTPREELQLDMSFVDYIETHYKLLSLAKKYENTPDSPIASYVRFDQMELNHDWAHSLSHNYERLENIENKVAELEKSGLSEPQIIFLDQDKFCQNMPLKYAEYKEEYIKEDVELNYLVLFKGENSTHRIYGEHLKLSPDKQALQSISDSGYEQYSNTTWIKEIFKHADYYYTCERKNDYKALLKYIVNNCPEIRLDELKSKELPKESIIKRAKRKARLILDFTKNNNNDNERYRER